MKKACTERSRSGFTLIELLVVISIIAVLSTIGLITYQGIQAKSRDSIRKSDLRAIATALEIYYQKNGEYPTTSTDKSHFPSYISLSSESQTWIPGLGSTYINPLPKDPVNTQTNGSDIFYSSADWHVYTYWAGDASNWTGCPGQPGQYYVLFTRLENANDGDIHQYKHYKKCDGTDILPLPADNTRYNQLYIVTSKD